MPRNNRRSRRQGGGYGDEDETPSIERVLMGSRRIEERRNGSWNVQPVTEAKAVKAYTCPGCTLPIDAGTAHLVAWRADGIMGDANDLAARRHWHLHCWKLGH